MLVLVLGHLASVRDTYICGAKQQQQQQQQQRTVTLVAVRVLGDDIEDACTLAARLRGHRVVVQRVATANRAGGLSRAPSMAATQAYPNAIRRMAGVAAPARWIDQTSSHKAIRLLEVLAR